MSSRIKLKYFKKWKYKSIFDKLLNNNTDLFVRWQLFRRFLLHKSKTHLIVVSYSTLTPYEIDSQSMNFYHCWQRFTFAYLAISGFEPHLSDRMHIGYL